jgi:Mor family transcriptional regulator
VYGPFFLVELTVGLANLRIPDQASQECLVDATTWVDVDSSQRERHRRLSPEEIMALADEYRTGDTIPALIARYGIHEATVHAHLNRQGVERRSVRRLTDAQAAEAAQQRDTNGATFAALAKRYGVSPDTVARAIRRFHDLVPQDDEQAE